MKPIEHAVGLVEHQDRDAGQIHRTLLGEVEQSPRRRDKNVAAASKSGDLRVDVHAAEHLHHAQRHVLAVIAGALGDLGGELAGRRQHQCSRSSGGGARAQPLQDGEHETRGLAGAGLRARQYVAPREHRGYRLKLDRGGNVVAFVGHGTEQFGHEPEIGK
jgi:hypothetical protein